MNDVCIYGCVYVYKYFSYVLLEVCSMEACFYELVNVK